MQRALAKVEALTLEAAGEPGIRLTVPRSLIPRPGQAMLALAPGVGQPLRRTLFPIRITERGFIAELPEGFDRQPGDEVDLVGPFGPGFSPPARAQRWLVGSFAPTAGRMLPLIDLGLSQGVEVSIWTKRLPPSSLPPQVEHTLDFASALRWADFLALEVFPDQMQDLRDRLRLEPQPQLAIEAQVLVTQTLPCGFGACGVCAVRGRLGWKYACRAGPVFDLADLVW